MDCCNDSVAINFHLHYSLHRWYHLCVYVNFEARKAVCVQNGKVSEPLVLPYTKILSISMSLYGNIIFRMLQVYHHNVTVDESKVNPDQGLQVAEGQRAVVGQDLDSLQGDFDASQILDGQVADYRLYNVALDAETMIAFTTCADNFVEEMEPFLSVTNGKLRAVGSVMVTSILNSNMCEETTEYLVLFPFKTSFSSSVYICDRLKGSLALPQDSESNRQLHTKFSKFTTQCNWLNILEYWIGTQFNVSLGKWVQLSDQKPLSWNNLGTASVNLLKNCMMVGTRKSILKWIKSSCEEYVHACFACNFTSQPQVRIRGLCKHSLFDRKMYATSHDKSYPQFEGERHSRIVWRNQQWIMESKVYKQLNATLSSSTSVISPLGRHTWIIAGDRCKETEVHKSFC